KVVEVRRWAVALSKLKLGEMNMHPQLRSPIAFDPGERRPRSGFTYLLRLWFGLSLPVGRRAYALTGFGLMLGKYAVDASVIHAVSGKFFSPLAYLNPLLSMRANAINPAPDWLMWALAAWTLPFMWVGASMSVRRAINAGRSAWV